MSDRMDMRAFAVYVEKHIGEYLPEGFKGAEIRCSVVDKPGYSHRSEHRQWLHGRSRKDQLSEILSARRAN